MPKLMERDDLMRAAVALGRSTEVWSQQYDSEAGEFNFSLPHGGRYEVVVMRIAPMEKKSPSSRREIRYGLMREKLKNWSYEKDREMDEEIVSHCECLKEGSM